MRLKKNNKGTEQKKMELKNNKIMEIIENKGATLDKDLKDFKSSVGYMVSIKGQEVKIDKNDVQGIKREIEKKREFIGNKKGLFIGLWLDSDIMFVDVSIHIVDYLKALEVARNNEQKAIFDLQNNESIYLNYLIYYNMYEVVRDNNDKIIDYKLVKQYDNIKDIKEDLKESTKAIYNNTFKSLEEVTRLLNNRYCFVKDRITLEELTA